MSDYTKPVTKVLALDEIEPPYDQSDKCPKSLTKTRRVDGVLYVAGKPPAKHEHTEEVQSDIMFVTTAVEEEEAQEMSTSSYGVTIRQKADYLRGPAGNLFKEVCGRSGIFPEEHYHTALVKWLLPKAKRSSPSAAVLKWGMPILLDEIARVKPKIVVCLGKKVFDMLSDTRMNFKDANGGWFWSTKANAHLYVMQSPYMMIPKPELHEMFRVDLTEIARKLDILKYGTINELPVNIEVIDNWRDLKEWQERMREDGTIPVNEDGYKILSVDGEWHGKQHIDGQLRSLQIAWNDSDAVYIKFRNENNEFCFDMEGAPADAENVINHSWTDDPPSGLEDWAKSLRLDPTILKFWNIDEDPDFASISQEKRDELRLYRKCGSVISKVTDPDDVKFVGHHYVADAVWMDRVLGMKVIGKCYMDTEFAQQTADESSELKLERGISMKYTTLGRYDLDLVLWKKDNKKLCEGGYGYIPDKIIIPYGGRDVLSVYRAVPFIRKLLNAQRLWDYYRDIFNPFVTDVFFTFAQTGLPMDVPRMDELRELFNWSQRELNAEFKVKITQDAKHRLFGKCVELLGPEIGSRAGVQTVNMIANGEIEKAWEELKTILPLDKFTQTRPFLDHLACAPTFNLRAPDQMRRWLYDVSGMTPIKTTNQKAKGLPSMDWQKVLELPKEKQALYTPSVDKQTLMILDSQLPLVSDLLDLNVVGNLCKAFLKEPEEYYDEDLDEMVVEEAGLHQWLATDETIRGQTSCTETGRPRGWSPNSLNWPSYVNKRIGKVMSRLIQQHVAAGTLPETLSQWSHVKDEKDLPSIRSVVKALIGWCLVESDYQTAEIRGMAYISGDRNLMRLMNDPDPEWAFTKDGYKVRVAYTDFSLSGIPTNKQNPDYILKRMEGGKVIAEYTEADLIRNEQTGEVVHCRYDLHWSIAEWTYEMPREEMIDKVHRAAGKVLNFSSAYGASPGSLERKIESDTGVKPADGTGQKGLDAIAARQPRATEFLEEMQSTPAMKGWYRAASGRIRHCVMHDRNSGVGYRQRNSIESAAGRELRNFPMQESVASTAARAGKWLGEFYRNAGMKARVITILYDSVVTMCPLEEREVVAHLHQQFMCDANNWVYQDEHGFRELLYPIDTEFNYRWSTKPSKAEKSQLEDMTWHPTPARMQWMLGFVAPKATPVTLPA
jgi:uracil-DNA glycosylase family 4